MIIMLSLGVLILRILYSLMEAYYERNWPKKTFRGLLLALGIFLMCSSVFAQAVRWDWQVTTINANARQPGGMYPVLALPGSGIAFCNAPANAVPCTNYATTYTSVAATSTCPSTAQLTRSNSTTCVANADSLGGFGVWIASGTYQYTVSTVYGNFGPYDVTVGFGSGPISGTNASFTGYVSAGATPPPGTVGLWGIASQGEINGATYATPDAAVTAACAGSKAVYFPAGVYTSGIPIRCNGLHVRCAARDTIASSGAIFRITGPNWGLWNPDADNTTAGSAANQRRSLTISDCAFDISTDPTNVLGAWRIKGVGASTFIGNNIFANSNTNPAITFDGSNWNQNGGNYDNDFFSNTLYDLAGSGPPTLGGSTGIGIYVTNCSTYAGATCGSQAKASTNDDHWYGGGISRFGRSIYIEGGGHNTFASVDAENAEQDCIDLMPAVAGGASGAGGNRFIQIRCETAIQAWSSGAKTVGTKIVDSNSNYQTVSTAGTTAGTAPTWCTTLNCTTTDGSVIWTLTQIFPVNVRATGTSRNTLEIYNSGTNQPIDDTTQQNTYEGGLTVYGSLLPSTPSTYGGNFSADPRGWAKYGIGKFPSPFDNNSFQGVLDVHGTIQSDRQIYLCNFTNGCYTATLGGTLGGSAVSTFSTSGAGTGAAFVVTATSNGVITGAKVTTPGTGYAVNDTITSIAQVTSSGTGAIFTVNSVDGGGGILTFTITNGGTGGYAIFKTNATGTPPVFNFNSLNGTNVNVVNCAGTGTSSQYCGGDGVWHNATPAGGGCTKLGSLSSPNTLTGTTSLTTMATIAAPVLNANSFLRIHADVFGNTGNTGILTVGAQWGGLGFPNVSGVSLANAYEIVEWEPRNEGSVSAQMVSYRFGKNGSNVSQAAAETALNTGSAANITIVFTPSLAADTWVLKAADVVLCP